MKINLHSGMMESSTLASNEEREETWLLTSSHHERQSSKDLNDHSSLAKTSLSYAGNS